MNEQYIFADIERFGEYTFSRSRGPGGQNVNKLNTKVLITIDLRKIPSLSTEEIERLSQSLSRQLKFGFFLSATAEEARTQYANKEIAIHKLIHCLRQGLIVEKKRIHTKPSKKSKLARLREKKTHSLLKQTRSSRILSD